MNRFLFYLPNKDYSSGGWIPFISNRTGHFTSIFYPAGTVEYKNKRWEISLFSNENINKHIEKIDKYSIGIHCKHDNSKFFQLKDLYFIYPSL